MHEIYQLIFAGYSEGNNMAAVGTQLRSSNNGGSSRLSMMQVTIKNFIFEY